MVAGNDVIPFAMITEYCACLVAVIPVAACKLLGFYRDFGVCDGIVLDIGVCIAGNRAAPAMSVNLFLRVEPFPA